MRYFWKIYEHYRVWKAHKFYGVDLIYVTPEEHAWRVPWEGN